MLLEATVDNGRIVLKTLDLWDKVWGCGKGGGSAEEAEQELDREKEEFWEKRSIKK